ncbi:hypothetical protein VTN77DRAFT_113 [Rasamsonia byssochlamydoides]|uniref:uncharacterized protein n=1 Tax=Rasamsonia byssochlamydoides TaxID=89139 RepID=UPI00374444D0
MAHILFRPLLAASITVASFQTGCQLSLSYVSIATVTGPPYVSEGVLLTQWKTLFARGFHLCPSSAFFSGLCCFANAALTYVSEGTSARMWTLLAAGSCMIGIVPFTLMTIVPLEKVLLGKEARLAKARREKVEGPEDEASAAETRRLLKRFNTLNYVRTILPVVGVIVAWNAWEV